MARSLELEQFTACGWRTVSYGAAELAAAAATLDAYHPGAAVVSSCQRLEAYSLGACACPAPDRWSGTGALARLAGVAAGLESVVLGESQILGQVRAAFSQSSGDLRSFADVAVASARQLRRETAFDSHAGHLLDRGLRVAGAEPGGAMLVLGAGALGRLIASRGLELGYRVTVAGRTPPACPERFAFVQLGTVGALPPVDVVAGCLGSGAGEIALAALPSARLVLDFGTPRNFATAPHAPQVVTIAALLADEQSRPHSIQRRRTLAARLAVIVRQRFSQATQDSSTAVGALRAEVESVRRREVSRARRLHPEIDDAALDAITRSLVDQLFHLPYELSLIHI